MVLARWLNPLGTAAVILCALGISPPAPAQTTVRVSVSSGGTQADWDGAQPSLSADGRYVAFVSGASNLVPGGTPDVNDVYVRDRQTSHTVCVSVATDGTRGNADSDSPAISADGRFVAFRSYASSLVPNDTNGVEDIFIRDIVLGRTTRLSVNPTGNQAVFPSEAPALSADGGVVVFSSRDPSLAPGGGAGVSNIYARDVTAGITTIISRGHDGSPANGDSVGPAVSADGRFIAFSTLASNIASGDLNGTADVILVNRLSGAARRVSVGSGGLEANSDSDSPSVSADGRFVAFRSYASNIATSGTGGTSGVGDIFLRDVEGGRTTLVSAGLAGAAPDGAGETPVVSADGRFVAFVSRATNLVPGDANGWEDVFIRDSHAGRTTLVSAGASGPGNYWSLGPAMTPNALYVAFASYATNLTTGDTNYVSDVFVRGPFAAPYAMVDAQRALAIAAGSQAASTLDLSRLDVVNTGAPAGIDLSDAARIARRALGLET